MTHEKDPVSGTVHREITDRDSRSAVTAASIAQNGGAYTYQYTADYYAQSGQAKSIEITNGGVSQQLLEYDYDVFGNLGVRSTNVSGGTTETLIYDDLQRLVTSTRSYNSGAPNDVVTYTYDKSGSFTSKSDYGSVYSYHADRPHVLTQVTLSGGGTVSFSHDENGNVTQGDGETITYNAFNKPTLIKSGITEMKFQYGADLMRYRQITPSGGTIYYLDKLMEIEQVGSTIDFRHYLGDIAVLTKTGDLNDPTPSVDYLIRDRLGSVALVGDNTGLLAETRAYDAFGKPRNANWSNKNPAKLNSNITDRGFTDHEHLDTWQLIHMNGRGYDYNLGRFLSIDPIIQAPGNSQSINPYTYIFNNPLSGTDPSGYAARSKWSDGVLRGNYSGLYGADGDYEDATFGGVFGNPGPFSFVGMGMVSPFNGVTSVDRELAQQRKSKVTMEHFAPDEIIPGAEEGGGGKVDAKALAVGCVKKARVCAAVGFSAVYAGGVFSLWMNNAPSMQAFRMPEARFRGALIVPDVPGDSANDQASPIEIAGGAGTPGMDPDNEPSQPANPNSVKQFGHTFKRHGQGNTNLNRLTDRARGTNQNQGQWLDNQQAAELLQSLRLDGPATVRIPSGLGRVVRPDGSIVNARWARVVPNPSGGIRTAYPIIP